MQLSELFVSHKQVDPVIFDRDEPILPQPIYLNLDRAKKVTTDDRTDDISDGEDVSTWSVDNDSDYLPWKVGTSSHVSDYNTALRKFIIDLEGFREEAYQDGKYYSIGYGFNGPQYKKGDRMTREEADKELERQLTTRENKYRRRFGSKWDNLTDNQKIALMSYGYNTGDANIIEGDVARYLDAGDMEKLRDSLKINTAEGKYNAGLEERRKRERALFDR
jgi:GH24 family phage-related lysozyme (muramidase)